MVDFHCLLFLVTFWGYVDFKSKKIKINLNAPIKSEQKAEAAELFIDVENGRNLKIQAAITRFVQFSREFLFWNTDKYVHLGRQES